MRLEKITLTKAEEPDKIKHSQRFSDLTLHEMVT